MTKAVQAKDAASLMLYRINNGQHEYLLGRRPAKSRFMPDVYVYPGGMVDLQDARANPASTLDARFYRQMAVSNSQARAQTLAMAAIRETFEETGLMVTRSGDPGTVQHETWAKLRELQQAPDLAILRYVGRAITPADQPIRFHARFFSVDFAQLATQNQTLDSNDELLDLDWYTEKALTDMPLRRVTRYMLDQLIAFLHGDDDDWIGSTMFTQRHGKIRITTNRTQLPDSQD